MTNKKSVNSTNERIKKDQKKRKFEKADNKWDNFSEWFDRIILNAEIIDDRYPVKGFSVYMGWGYSIVKRIYRLLEDFLESENHLPMQFPVVIPETAFQTEEDHIEGFSSEVFWITHAGDNKLVRRLLLRPTSETAIYPMFKNWIRSHADLPLRIHQTCNVYRYETRATRPLFRGREFLWNEAHTIHASYEEAEQQVKKGVDIYKKVFDLLGLSYIILKRPNFDKFAGADYSLAFDTWNPDGKINQIGTVHQLGENFAKAFNLKYEDEDGEQIFASTTCYGMGLGRTLAAIITHYGDNNGVMLPPNIAPKQAVIIPIPFKGREEDVLSLAKKIEEELSAGGIRVFIDDDNRLRPGEKFYKWEMFGVPVRLEIGPKEFDSKTVSLVRRDKKERIIEKQDNLIKVLNDLFSEIFENLRSKSWKTMKSLIINAASVDELKTFIEEKKIVRINWCCNPKCAIEIKEKIAGEVRGSLWEKKEKPKGQCIMCGSSAVEIAYVSRTY